MRQSSISPEHQQDVITAFVLGETQTDIAKDFGTSRRTIYRVLLAHGYILPKPKEYQ